MTEQADNFWADASDELIMAMVHLGEEPGITEAKRRGLPIPGPVDTSMDQIPETSTLVDFEVGPDTPRESLPMGLLVDAVAEGDTEAARVLHERYPYLYDENGEEIQYDTPLD